MNKPRIAIISFPGNNCEVESIRSINRNGMEAVSFRWNDDTVKLKDIDGYFLPGGFSYEDRGRAGMVAARDPLMAHITEEALSGKPIIGNCNGAQVLIESGLIPHGDALEMALAKNVCTDVAVGFLNEWLWITPDCERDRCCTSNWEGVMHIPIAHGEGRFMTKDKDLLKDLLDNGQVAFGYCDSEGKAAPTAEFNPNGSDLAIAGICNPAGNVVALMPHPERSPNGDAYFRSLKNWIDTHPPKNIDLHVSGRDSSPWGFSKREPREVEVFIDTIIVNNEERTVEQAARRIAPKISLKQLKYFSVSDHMQVLGSISLFNPNKEIAYIRRGSKFYKWDSDAKKEEAFESVLRDVNLLRRDEPDTGAMQLKQGSQTGVCYACSGISDSELKQGSLAEIFGNPHSSTLELL